MVAILKVRTKEDSGLITHCRFYFCMIKCIINYGDPRYHMQYTNRYYNYNVHGDRGNHLEFVLIYMYSLCINFLKLGMVNTFNSQDHQHHILYHANKKIDLNTVVSGGHF